MKAKLVDVFTNKRFSGNGLTIFESDNLSTEQMQTLTCEMRQFESIFYAPSTDNQNTFHARIFTMEEELDFAGHPCIGLGAYLHSKQQMEDELNLVLQLNKKDVYLHSSRKNGYYSVQMDQGKAEFCKTLTKNDASLFYNALGIKPEYIPAQAAEVVSTGLPYVVLPVNGGIESVAFTIDDLSPYLSAHNAAFLYVIDVSAFGIKTFEGRTWDNKGQVEDAATGSAAGPVAAYLCKHGLAAYDSAITINQGRFIKRESILSAEVSKDYEVKVSGDVIMIADIEFND